MIVTFVTAVVTPAPESGPKCRSAPSIFPFRPLCDKSVTKTHFASDDSVTYPSAVPVTNPPTTMQHANTLTIALGLALGLQVPAFAGTEVPPVAPAPANNGNWCTWLQNKPGTLYKNKENPWLQEFQLEGRFQYQTAYVDGSDVNGQDFNQKYDEYRRVRIGAKAKFLQYFGAKYQVNLVDDARNSCSGGDLDWGYDDIDEAYLSFDLGKALGQSNPFDELQAHLRPPEVHLRPGIPHLLHQAAHRRALRHLQQGLWQLPPDRPDRGSRQGRLEFHRRPLQLHH